MEQHVPVLREETLEQLVVRQDGCYFDGTFGRGGHSRGILQRLAAGGRLLAMDRDPAAVEAGQLLDRADPRFAIGQGDFAHMREFLADHGVVPGMLDGILLDIGVSSPQLDDAGRGFSFLKNGPLDMRMDPGQGISAADWLNSAEETEIARVLRSLGEEKAARRIARAIVRRRREQSIETTGQLAEIVAQVVPRKPAGRHPATRCFQAIRMHVNRELEQLEQALAQAVDLLAPGGRLCVISFHSLEDRMVKRFLRDQSRVDPALAGLPIVPESARPRLRLPVGAVRPGGQELQRNPRARSATLRVGERL